MTRAPRLLAAAAVLTVAFAAVACGVPAPPPTPGVTSGDPARSRIVGALPNVDGGVYLVDLERAGDLSPGSRIAPLVADLVGDAEFLLESMAPPVTVLSGVAADAPVPQEAIRVDDNVVFAGRELAEDIVGRLRDDAAPEPQLSPLAATDAPVAWTGPSPAPDAPGRTTVAASPELVTVTIAGLGQHTGAVASRIEGELASGAPPGSPGKPWNRILGDAEVTAGDGAVTVTAVPVDLPGPFLRILLDGQQLTFLAVSP